jgi:hypothetical protein
MAPVSPAVGPVPVEVSAKLNEVAVLAWSEAGAAEVPALLVEQPPPE